MQKKILFVLFMFLLVVNVNAGHENYYFRILANSNQEVDIDRMYEVKDDILNTYTSITKGFSQMDIDVAITDNLKDFSGKDYRISYYNGEIKIVIGKGAGKEISGELKQNYCEEVKVKKTKFFLLSWLGL